MAVNGSMVLPCSCQHTYQDKKYGRGNRVHNATGTKKQQTGESWRCTVCGRLRKD